ARRRGALPQRAGQWSVPQGHLLLGAVSRQTAGQARWTLLVQFRDRERGQEVPGDRRVRALPAARRHHDRRQQDVSVVRVKGGAPGSRCPPSFYPTLWQIPDAPTVTLFAGGADGFRAERSHAAGALAIWKAARRPRPPKNVRQRCPRDK